MRRSLVGATSRSARTIFGVHFCSGRWECAVVPISDRLARAGSITDLSRTPRRAASLVLLPAALLAAALGAVARLALAAALRAVARLALAAAGLALAAALLAAALRAVARLALAGAGLALTAAGLAATLLVRRGRRRPRAHRGAPAIRHAHRHSIAADGDGRTARPAGWR